MLLPVASIQCAVPGGGAELCRKCVIRVVEKRLSGDAPGIGMRESLQDILWYRCYTIVAGQCHDAVSEAEPAIKETEKVPNQAARKAVPAASRAHRFSIADCRLWYRKRNNCREWSHDNELQSEMEEAPGRFT